MKIIFLFTLLFAFFSCENLSPSDLEEQDDYSYWSGSESSFETNFSNSEVNGTYLLYENNSGNPYTGQIKINNQDGTPWIKYSYFEGKEDGERIVWMDGEMYEHYLYSHGKLKETLMRGGRKVQ